MRMFAVLVASALIVAPAFAADDKAEKSEGKKICRTIKLDTGTRLSGKKVCKTEAQWAAAEARTANDLRSLPNSSR